MKTAFNKPNGLRHFDPTEKNEESVREGETHQQRNQSRGKKEHADTDAEKPGH